MWHNGDQTKFKSNETKSSGEAISRADLFWGPSPRERCRDGDKNIWNNTIQYSGAVRSPQYPCLDVFCEPNTGNYIFTGSPSAEQRTNATWLSSKYLAFNVLFDSDGRLETSQSVRRIWEVFSQESNDRVWVHSDFRVLKYFCFLHLSICR